MTTRPTDEEIRAMRQWAYRNRGDIGDKVYQFAEAWLAERQTARNGVIINEREAFDVLVDAACEAINKIHKVGKKRFKADMTAVVKAVIEAQARAALDQRQEVTEADAHFYWRYVDGSSLPEGYDLPRGLTAGVPDSTCRQRAEHYGATIEVLRSIKWTLGDSPKSIPDATSLGRWLALHLRSEYPNVSNRIPEFCWIVETLLAAQSIAPPIKSVSDALNFLEEWALAGNKLHGDDIQRFHATVERIAPVAKTVKVPEEKEDLDPVKLHRQGRFATEFERGFNEGWNDCREAMLSAAPAYNGKKEG